MVKKYKGLFVLFGVVVFLQLIVGLLITTQFDTWADRGTFGDMFGAVNTLFSGLAFAGVIYAIFLQGKELELQREELKMTRDELAKSADAQNAQVEMMLHAAKINATSSKLDTYSTMLAGNKRVAWSDTATHEHVKQSLEELELLIQKAEDFAPKP